MNLCMVCLSPNPDKDVYEIQTNKKMDNRTFADIILFCLDIQVNDAKISTKICTKCYKKIVSFHKFKMLAIKNDEYLKSHNSVIKNEILLKIEDVIKMEIIPASGDAVKDELLQKNEEILDDYQNDANDDFEVKNEETSHDYQSDDELLSVIKKIKYEYVDGDTKENVTEPIEKKRGRPKKEKKKDIKIEKKRVCEECGVAIRNLKEHMQIHLPVGKRIRVPCSLCDKTFSSASSKYKHIKRKHLGIKKHCKECDKKVVNLKQHVLVVHNSASLPYECIACGRRFISQSRLEMHMSLHTKDRPFPCQQCDKRFRTKVNLVMHTRQVHDKEKTHLCQFCSKSFFKKNHLQIHLRSHTKEKPYPCKQCGKCFASSTLLKNHELIHSSIKMYLCTVCDMSFIRSGYLRAHMLSHTKEKRYPCQYCGVKFHRSDHRRRHEFTAHKRHLAGDSRDA